MPKGLLDKLTREEILHLISYIAAGDPNHPLFRGTMPQAMGMGAQGGIEMVPEEAGSYDGQLPDP